MDRDRKMVSSSSMVIVLVLCCSLLASFMPSVHAVDSPVNTTASSTTAGKTYVFVHGGFTGAWAWYKVAAMLEEVNFNIVMLNMASSGVDKTSAADIKTIANYSMPLTDYLSSINFKVLLVAHGIGGAAVTYAMEMYPNKIEKAIFVQAVMPKDGETPGLHINGQLATLAAQDVVLYKFNDKGMATSISINTTVAPDYLFNRSPLEDNILGMSLLTDSPYAILNEVMHLTSGNYGLVKRFYITSNMDRFFPAAIQKQIYTRNPPKAKFVLKNGDHSPFFSEAPYLFDHLRSLANSQW